MKNLFLITLLTLFPLLLFSQKVVKDSSGALKSPVATGGNLITSIADTVKALSDKNGKKKFMPVPKKATRFAFIPGGGQIYNRDYWKLSIVYLAMGGGIYTYHLNSLKYRDFLAAYKSFYNLETGELLPGITTDTRRNVYVRNLLATSGDSVLGTRDAIDRQKNYWRRNRNLAIIVTGLIYTLSIVEANVAAHLKTFDLSDDLTLRIEPKITQPLVRQPAPGVRLVFNFK